MGTPLKTFIIYARADAPFKDELLTHLHPFVEHQLIQKWVDSDLLPGEDWEKRIEKELEAAHLVIILVSADALSSNFIRQKELKTALEKKRAGSARVAPILVRDCYWKLDPDLSEMQLLPKDESGKIRGVAGWLSKDTAWLHCCEALHKLILEIHNHLAKEADEKAQQAVMEAQKQAEAKQKAEKVRARRDDAFWEKIQVAIRKTEAPEHNITLLEDYLDDQEHFNHREEAEDALDKLRADLMAAKKMEEARLKRETAEAKRKEETDVNQREKVDINITAPESTARRLKEGIVIKQVSSDSEHLHDQPEMILVKGGTFQMGNPNVAKPTHTVVLPDFEIGKYLVNQRLWKEIMGNNPSHFKGDTFPVESVSWDDCQIFIQTLNNKTGKKYRLPTEAEWEFAARGGTLSNGFQYAGSNEIKEVAWHIDNANSSTHPVGLKNPNEIGLYDMSGNVWEWCADWHGVYSSEAQENPSGPKFGSTYVFRGGSWRNFARYCDVAVRSSERPTIRDSALGFRLAASPE